MSQYEERLARLIEIHGLPKPERQYRFAMPLREYRADFAWPDHALLVEVDGGAFVGRGGSGPLVSRTTPVGYHQTIEDYRKRNLANLLGYTLLCYQPGQLDEAIKEITLWLDHGQMHVTEEALEQHVAVLASDDSRRRKTREFKAKLRKGRAHYLTAGHRVRVKR